MKDETPLEQCIFCEENLQYRKIHISKGITEIEKECLKCRRTFKETFNDYFLKSEIFTKPRHLET